MGAGSPKFLPSYTVTILKFLAIALLFAPMWGFTWHHVNFNSMWNFTWATERMKAQVAFGEPVKAALYAAVYAVALIGIFLIPFIRGNILRIAMVAILMTGWTFDHFFLEMNGVFSNRDLISLLWDEWHLAGDAISAYKLPLFHNVLLAIPIVIVFCMPPERPISLARYWAVLPGSALICVAGMINSANTGALLFPVPYSLVSTAGLLTLGVGGNRPFGYFTARNIDSNRSSRLRLINLTGSKRSLWSWTKAFVAINFRLTTLNSIPLPF